MLSSFGFQIVYIGELLLDKDLAILMFFQKFDPTAPGSTSVFDYKVCVKIMPTNLYNLCGTLLD
jgi:hypothetical protein